MKYNIQLDEKYHKYLSFLVKSGYFNYLELLQDFEKIEFRLDYIDQYAEKRGYLTQEEDERLSTIHTDMMEGFDSKISIFSEERIPRIIWILSLYKETEKDRVHLENILFSIAERCTLIRNKHKIKIEHIPKKTAHKRWWSIGLLGKK